MKGDPNNDNDLPDANYDHLFNNDEGATLKVSSKKSLDSDVSSNEQEIMMADQMYILGTLIVRVVAARHLPAASGDHGNGFGFLFGGIKGSAAANPYASVNFGTSTQRTTSLYDTRDPVWPRGETMFMDVALPIAQVSHPDKKTTGPEASSEGDEIRVSSSSSSESTTTRTRPHQTNNHLLDACAALDVPRPLLTVAVFSADNDRGSGKTGKGGKKQVDQGGYPSKAGVVSGDSDDEFLGVASLDLTPLITGKRPMVDTWLPLTSSTSSGSVHVVCEYEPTDVPPNIGDRVRFTRFCHPADLFPLCPGQIYAVQGVVDQDRILLGYTSPEGWICSAVVHRNMVICVNRHYGAAQVCREEWQSITERLSHSPMIGTVAQAVEKLPEEGLLALGANTFQGGANLLGRWLDGGLETVAKDVAFATNWDGRFNPGSEEAYPRGDSGQQAESTTSDSEDTNTATPSSPDESKAAASTRKNPGSKKDPLPNMPCCPITGEPMLDPVVAADGHTYERVAISRWLQTSDKSPLTGSILPHKELVPNYGLLSSLEEQAGKQLQLSSEQSGTAATASDVSAEQSTSGGSDID